MNTVYQFIDSLITDPLELNNNVILLEDSIEFKGNLHNEYQCKSYKSLKIRLMKVKILKEYNYYICLTSKFKISLNSSMDVSPKLNSLILNSHWNDPNTLSLTCSATFMDISTSDLSDDKYLNMKFFDEESYKKWQYELSNILVELHCIASIKSLPSGRLSSVKMNQCIQYCKLLLPSLKLQNKLVYQKLERLYTIRIKLNEVMKALQIRSSKLNLEDVHQLQQICSKSITNHIDIELELDPDVIFLCTKLTHDLNHQYEPNELENVCKSIGMLHPSNGYDEMEEMEANHWEWEGIDAEVTTTSSTPLIHISSIYNNDTNNNNNNNNNTVETTNEMNDNSSISQPTMDLNNVFVLSSSTTYYNNANNNTYMNAATTTSSIITSNEVTLATAVVVDSSYCHEVVDIQGHFSSIPIDNNQPLHNNNSINNNNIDSNIDNNIIYDNNSSNNIDDKNHKNDIAMNDLSITNLPQTLVLNPSNVSTKTIHNSNNNNNNNINNHIPTNNSNHNNKPKKGVKATLNGISIHNNKAIVPVTPPRLVVHSKNDSIKKASPNKKLNDSLSKLNTPPTSNNNNLNNSAKKLYKTFFKSKPSPLQLLNKSNTKIIQYSNSKDNQVNEMLLTNDDILIDDTTKLSTNANMDDYTKSDTSQLENHNSTMQFKTPVKEKKSYMHLAFNHFKSPNKIHTSTTNNSSNNNNSNSKDNNKQSNQVFKESVNKMKMQYNQDRLQQDQSKILAKYTIIPANSAIIGDFIPVRKGSLLVTFADDSSQCSDFNQQQNNDRYHQVNESLLLPLEKDIEKKVDRNVLIDGKDNKKDMIPCDTIIHHSSSEIVVSLDNNIANIEYLNNMIIHEDKVDNRYDLDKMNSSDNNNINNNNINNKNTNNNNNNNTYNNNNNNNNINNKNTNNNNNNTNNNKFKDNGIKEERNELFVTKKDVNYCINTNKIINNHNKYYFFHSISICIAMIAIYYLFQVYCYYTIQITNNHNIQSINNYLLEHTREMINRYITIPYLTIKSQLTHESFIYSKEHKILSYSSIKDNELIKEIINNSILDINHILEQKYIDSSAVIEVINNNHTHTKLQSKKHIISFIYYLRYIILGFPQKVILRCFNHLSKLIKH